MPRGDTQRKYSKKLHQVICDNLREGRPRTLSFRLSGVDPDTVWGWLSLGRSNPAHYPEYVELARDIDEAIAQAEAAALGRIQAAAKSDPKHWTADAWYLERTNPKEYGKRDHLEIEGGTRPLVQLNQLVLVDLEAREEAHELLRRVAGSALTQGDDVIDAAAEEVDKGVA